MTGTLSAECVAVLLQPSERVVETILRGTANYFGQLGKNLSLLRQSPSSGNWPEMLNETATDTDVPVVEAYGGAKPLIQLM